LHPLLSGVFYKLANWMTSGLLPESVSDFRLLNRKTYFAIRSLHESHRFLRDLGAWVGFKNSRVEIERPVRFAGESKWLGMPHLAVLAIALISILAYSAKPFAWVSILDFFVSFVSIFSLFLLTAFWLIFGVPCARFGSLIRAIVLRFSLIML